MQSGCNHADVPALLGSLYLESDHTLSFGKKCMILAATDINSAMHPCSTLPENNSARIDGLAAKDLYAKTLGFRIATVSCAAACFFMCHS